jgi:hypothetical protein
MGCDEDAMEIRVFPNQYCINEPKKVVATMNIFLPIAISLFVLFLAMLLYVSKSGCTCPTNK